MENWTTEGHLTELALEQRAAGELAGPELQAISSHMQSCQACRGRDAAWRGLFLALASLQGAEPSTGFDDRVMARVRLPDEARTATPSLMPRTIRRLRRIAVAAAAVWTAGLAGSAVWLHSQLDVAPGLLLARLLSAARDLLLAGVVKLGALLHVSGLSESVAGVIATVPGPGLAGALAAMTALSGLAIWTLHRVIEYEPSRVDAHV